MVSKVRRYRTPLLIPISVCLACLFFYFASAEPLYAQSTDLEIVKRGPTGFTGSLSTGGAIGIAGTTVTYTIHITNTSGMAASQVNVQDNLPPGLSIISFDVMRSDPTEGFACGVLGCFLGTVDAGEVVSITIATLLDPSLKPSSIITNSASVSSLTDDSDPNNNISYAAIAIQSLVDISVTKRSLVDVIPPDGTYINEIAVTNHGPSDAYGVVVTDTLPADASLVGGLPTGCLEVGGQLICSIEDPLSVGETAKLLYSLQAGDVVSGTLLSNSVVVGTDSIEVDTTNNQASNSVTVEFGVADLELDKSTIRGFSGSLGSDAPLVVAGTTVTYTIVVTNNGPLVAHFVEIHDELPPGLSLERYESITHSANDTVDCTGLICYAPRLGVGESITVVAVARLQADLPSDDPLINRAIVYSQSPDDNPGNNFDFAKIIPVFVADISIIKTDLSDPVAPGEHFLYEIGVFNDGPSAAPNVMISDTLPSELIFNGASPGCTFANGTVSCAVSGLLPPNGFAHFLIGVEARDVPSGTIITNLAWGTTSVIDPSSSNNGSITLPGAANFVTTTVQTKPGPKADLSITKSSSASEVTAGQSIDFSILVRNDGPQMATQVELRDLVPFGALLTSITPVNSTDSNIFCTLAGNCFLGQIPAGGTATVDLTMGVDSGYAQSTLLNQVHVTAHELDPDITNNMDSYSVDVIRLAQLELVKTGPSQAIPGQEISYQILVTNLGPSDAMNVVVTDTLPAELSQATAATDTGSCVFAGSNLLQCSVGTLSVGDMAEIQLSALIESDALGTITNVAFASPLYRSETTTNLDPEADLVVNKSATPTTVGGGRVEYTLTVYNYGPSDAQDVIVTDDLPSEITFIAAESSGACSESIPGSVVCTQSSLEAGSSTNFTLVGLVDANVEPGSSLQNNVAVSAETRDPMPSNNSANADTSIIGLVELVIDKSGPATAVAGENVDYILVIMNKGPSIAQSVRVEDLLPSGMNFRFASAERSGSSSAADCGIPLCQIGDMNVGETVTVTVSARVQSSVRSNSVLTNTGVVYSDSPELNLDNNQDSMSTQISTSADLSVSKIALGSRTSPGSGVIFDIIVQNNGPSDAFNIVLTDTLPAGMTISNVSPSCPPTIGNATLICEIDRLRDGEGIRYLLAADVSPQAGGVAVNSVTVDAETADGDETNNTSTAPVLISDAVGAPADLQITKSADTTEVRVGDQVTYSLSVQNLGPAVATNVQLLDRIPVGTTISSISVENPDSTLELCNLVGTCYIGTLLPGSVATVDLVLQVVSASAGQTLDNIAVVLSDQGDSTLSDNIDTETVQILGPEGTQEEIEDPTAISLATLSATWNPDASGQGYAQIHWTTTAEFNTLGYRIYRGQSADRDSATEITLSLIFSEGSGSGLQRYYFKDSHVLADMVYNYWLVEQELDGTLNFHGPVRIETLQLIGGAQLQETDQIFIPAVIR